jgi:hypothetical protein
MKMLRIDKKVAREESRGENEIVARKNGHSLGCDCCYCERLRAILKPKSEKEKKSK